MEGTGISIVDGIGSTEMMHLHFRKRRRDPRRLNRPRGAGLRGDRARSRRQSDGRGEGRLAVKGRPAAAISMTRARRIVVEGWNLTATPTARTLTAIIGTSRSDDMIVSSGYNIGAPEGRMPSRPSRRGRMRGDRRALPRAEGRVKAFIVAAPMWRPMSASC